MFRGQLETIRMADLKKVLAKLDRPPFVHNFVRLVADDPLPTARNIVDFVRGQPQFQYGSGYAVIRDKIQLGISLDQALRAVQSSGSPKGRHHNASLVRAFFDWDRVRKYSASSIIEFERAYFRVSREILVPVSPLSIIRENGQFVPLFVCGWNDLDLSLQQRRLHVTICDDAFLSLEDFKKSPAEFLFFPRDRSREPKQPSQDQIVRVPEVWSRSDYELLSRIELTEQVEIFLEGRRLAHAILQEMADAGKFNTNPPQQPPSPAGVQGSLL